ncbi:hypothetical protein [Haloechinothrix salitolerans]|uniref:Uncharacterized protein n=1 Tax=Haloechinothrix salitolerans TaxID=926830 RepID=A0ABW2BSE1_9PSEU
MGGIVLACGTSIISPAVLARAGLEQHRIVPVPARPGKSDVDAELAKAADRSDGPGADVVVAGTDADLAAVALRLLRRDRLGVSVGYVPTARSACAALWGLPTDTERALRLAATEQPHGVPLIRDDVGGVLVGVGTLRRVDGIAYCDDDMVLRGTAHRIDVSPDTAGGPGLTVTLRYRRFGRQRRTVRGRAFAIGCEPTTPVLDGVARERTTERWTWYRHTEDLLLVRPG